MIERDYHYTLFTDDLPSAYVTNRNQTKIVKYENGMPLGLYDPFNERYFIYNHLKFTIMVHESRDKEDSYSIVGFNIEPLS